MDGESIELRGTGRLLDLCLSAKIAIDHVCGGGASCGTCRVLVVKGAKNLPLRNELEQEMASDRDFSFEERLACQLEISQESDFIFEIPPSE
ncbi:MAG: (2Fe-2S)-binding protein [Bdellovibrionales bacterium]|nr:(2Fe-2S)-binding protein [Bdellovibrionales bacterium]